MEKLLAIPVKQGQSNARNHHVVGEISRIEEFAHCRVRQPIHESQAGLKTENSRLQPDEERVEETGDEHVVQLAGFTVEAGVEQHRVEVTKQVEHAVERAGRVKTDKRVNQPDANRVRRQQERPERDRAAMQTEHHQTHQRHITLGGVVNESVMPE